MTYELYIGDRMYSSWSLRGWLMLEKFAIPHQTHLVGLFSGTMAADMAHLAPARLVPALRTDQGLVIGESLAMGETLAEQFPSAGLWPSAADQRATARWLVTEMVAGFAALRRDCPMQLSHVWQGFAPSTAVLSDLARIETLFAHARSLSGAKNGPLFGTYSLADVFYTPVAARIIGYGLPVSEATRAYCEMLMADPAVLHWQEQARRVSYETEPYQLDLPRAPWPIG